MLSMFSLLLASCMMSWTAFNSFFQPRLTRFDSKFDRHKLTARVRMTCTKIQAALDSDISLYTSFECQVKCTSNLESALSVTVHRITVHKS